MNLFAGRSGGRWYRAFEVSQWPCVAYHEIIEEVDATQCDAMRLPSNSVKKHSLLSLSIKIIHSKGYTDFYAGWLRRITRSNSTAHSLITVNATVAVQSPLINRRCDTMYVCTPPTYARLTYLSPVASRIWSRLSWRNKLPTPHYQLRAPLPRFSPGSVLVVYLAWHPWCLPCQVHVPYPCWSLSTPG